MILDSSLTLEAVLAGAVSANQPEFHVCFVVKDNTGNPVPRPGVLRGALNSATDVTILSPEDGGYSTEGYTATITYLAIYNKDTAAATPTVKTTDGTTDRILFKPTLAAGETLEYVNER